MKFNEAKWAEIDLDALSHNMKSIREKVGHGRKIAAVIKANGYGHGSVEIADTLLEAGADQFAVSFLDEAKELRRHYPDTDILVLGAMPDDAAEEATLSGFQQTVVSYQRAQAISEAAERIGQPARVHVKLDTGMTRLGFQMTEESLDEVEQIANMPNLVLEGIFTHFATADERDKTYANKQYQRYEWFVGELEKRGLNIPLKHTSNSAAIMELPNTYLNMVRPGIVLYGIYPSEEVDPGELDIKPVMTFKARISHVKTLPEDRGISYGQRHRGKTGDVIATIPVGYADGYTRVLSGKAKALYKGRLVSVVGNICMDQCMLDVSGIENVQVGDEVILFGTDGENSITANDLGALYGTIGYEVVCGVNRRVPRIYIKDGNIVSRVSYLEK